MRCVSPLDLSLHPNSTSCVSVVESGERKDARFEVRRIRFPSPFSVPFPIATSLFRNTNQSLGSPSFNFTPLADEITVLLPYVSCAVLLHPPIYSNYTDNLQESLLTDRRQGLEVSSSLCFSDAGTKDSGSLRNGG